MAIKVNPFVDKSQSPFLSSSDSMLIDNSDFGDWLTNCGSERMQITLQAKQTAQYQMSLNAALETHA